jgi:AcrR family transcriptional regulator
MVDEFPQSSGIAILGNESRQLAHTWRTVSKSASSAGNHATSDAKNAKRREIVAAATDCFARYGVQRTRIEDAASAAGISPTNFYNFYPNRAALIDAVTLDRAATIVDHVAPAIAEAPSLTEAVVNGVAQTVAACRADEVFMQLLRLTRHERLGQLGMTSTAFGYEFQVRLWRPALEKARQRGDLRGHLDGGDDTIAWLGAVIVMFLLNDRMSTEDIRRMASLFVAPAIAEF